MSNPIGLAAGFDKHGDGIDGKCSRYMPPFLAFKATTRLV